MDVKDNDKYRGYSNVPKLVPQKITKHNSEQECHKKGHKVKQTMTLFHLHKT